MKACFFLQRRFALIGHAMAHILKEQYGVTQFCGLVNLRTSFEFLKEQQDIPYTQLILEEEIYARYKNEPLDPGYIAWLEKEYGLPTLWPYINMDRILRYGLLLRGFPSDTPQYSHEDLLRIVQVTAKAIIQFLDEEKPDFVFFSVVSNLSSMLLFHIAKKKGIKTTLFFCPRVENKYSITTQYDEFYDLEKAFARFNSEKLLPVDVVDKEKAEKYLSTFQDRPTYYGNASAAAGTYANSVALRRKHFAFLNPGKIFNSIYWLGHLFFEYFTNPHSSDYSIIKPWHHVIDKVKNKMRVLRGYNDLYDKPNADDTYAYFSLHSEPEALPMLLAPFYRDQAWLVEQAAQSLPATYKLYVKDHPRMMGKRTRAFYERLKKIPNVCLLDSVESSLGIIQSSKLVFAVTGTAGFEAVMCKKPAIVFGKVFYSKVSMIRTCSDITTLPIMVQNQLDHFAYQHTELVNFIAAIYAESVDLDLSQIWDVEGSSQVLGAKQAELIPIVGLLAKKVGLEPIL